MKVLVLTKYADAGPSSRVRFVQYFSVLQEQGITIDWKPLLDNHYIQSSYKGLAISPGYLLKHYWQRFKDLLSCKQYDVIWLEAELLPYLPAFLENLFYRLYKIPVIVNYDDAIFHHYDLSSNPIKKFLLKNKIAEVMKHAHTVIVGNNYLEQYAIKAGAKNILKIPTVVDTRNYGLKNLPKDKKRPEIRIGWIGTPSTFQYLKLLTPVFQKLASQVQIKVYVMGVHDFAISGVEVECIPWSIETEIPFLQSLDIGVMPLKDSPWERGKCGYKLIQYLACGKAVVGTPIEINAEIIEEGINGFWASTEDEWLDALLKLCQNPVLRTKMGLAGRKKVEEKYSLKVTAPIIVNALKQAKYP